MTSGGVDLQKQRDDVDDFSSWHSDCKELLDVVTNNICVLKCLKCIERKEFVFQTDLIRHEQEYHDNQTEDPGLNLNGFYKFDQFTGNFVVERLLEIQSENADVCPVNAEIHSNIVPPIFAQPRDQVEENDAGECLSEMRSVDMDVDKYQVADVDIDIVSPNVTQPTNGDGDGKLQCCNKSSTKKKAVKGKRSSNRRRKQIKKPITYHCDLCKAKLLQPINSQILRNSQHKVYPACCPTCETSFSDLDLHVTIKSAFLGEKSYNCGICCMPNRTISLAFKHLSRHTKKNYRIRASKDFYIVTAMNPTRNSSAAKEKDNGSQTESQPNTSASTTIISASMNSTRSSTLLDPCKAVMETTVQNSTSDKSSPACTCSNCLSDPGENVLKIKVRKSRSKPCSFSILSNQEQDLLQPKSKANIRPKAVAKPCVSSSRIGMDMKLGSRLARLRMIQEGHILLKTNSSLFGKKNQ